MTEALRSGISKNKVQIIFIAKILIAVGLILYLVFSVSLGEISSGLQTANLPYIFFALILLAVNLFLQYKKWEITCKYILEEENKSKIKLSLFYGIAAGSFTPARVGEYFGRAVPFRDKPLLEITIATFVDKVFPLLIVAFCGSLSSILFIHYYYAASVYLTASLFILLFVLFYLMFLILLNPRFWNNILFKNIKKSKRLYGFLKHFKILRELDRFYAFQMFFFSFLFYTCFIVQYALLASAFSLHPAFWTFILAGNLVMFSKTIIPPVSLGELGIREGASVFFIKTLGDTAIVGFNASIFLFIINILLPSLIGLFLLLKKNDN